MDAACRRMKKTDQYCGTDGGPEVQTPPNCSAAHDMNQRNGERLCRHVEFRECLCGLRADSGGGGAQWEVPPILAKI